MSSYVRQLQTRLKDAGLYTGEIDGIAGKLTVQAVELAIAKGVCTTGEQKDVAVIHATDPTVDGNEHLLDKPIPIATVKNIGFELSENSLKKLVGVNPNLVKVVKRAIEITGIDFRITEGVRTKERQALLVKQGKSKTMNSRHLTGDAVDLVAIVDGERYLGILIITTLSLKPLLTRGVSLVSISDGAGHGRSSLVEKMHHKTGSRRTKPNAKNLAKKSFWTGCILRFLLK